MNRGIMVAGLLGLMLIASAGMAAADDGPRKGEWKFNARKLWETDSAGDDVLVGISRIRTDGEGNIYVMSRKDTKIFVLDKNGNFLFAFGSRGEGPGEIKQMYDFWILGDNIFVADMGKILFFSLKGAFVKEIKIQKMLIPVIMLDSHRMLAVSFPSFRKKDQLRDVFIYNLISGETTSLFGTPAPKILRYAKNGTRLMLRMPGAAPVIAAELVPGGFLTAYSDQFIITRRDLEGKRQFDITLKDRKPEMISPAGKLLLVKKAVRLHQNIPKNIIHELTDQIPDSMPYFRSIHSLGNGMIGVLVPRINHPEELGVDVFSQNGEYLYRGAIRLRETAEIIAYAICDDGLAVFFENPEGDQILSKYHLDVPRIN